eukprot:TRINITY_DN2385_c0_g1_i1.p1 TRINITY_DN2385_c0_g1~~TRINITY_DN2385_c0_g1_i1.p1  ORF type:complete len:228 (-),score=48.94 TRINITY_DN2385_c0_g1_i1:243-827(-)
MLRSLVGSEMCIRDRGKNDLEKALYWRLSWGMVLYGGNAVAQRAILMLLGVMVGESTSLWSVITKTCLYALMFAPIVFPLFITFSLMWINNSGNFRCFLEQENVLSLESYITLWGVPSIVTGLIVWLPVSIVTFATHRHVQILVNLLFMVYSNCMQQTLSLAHCVHIQQPRRRVASRPTAESSDEPNQSLCANP